MEWSTVTKKKAIKVSSNTKSTLASKIVNHTDASNVIINTLKLNTESVVQDVILCKENIKKSSYFKYVSDSLRKQLGDQVNFFSILALGIGSLSSPISILQLALYLCLCENFLNETSHKCVYDPVLTMDDFKILKEFQIESSTNNFKGKHRVSNEGITLFFLPHCPYRLYCNLLWENWNNLGKLVIFGNSFQSYSLRRISKSQATIKSRNLPCKKRMHKDGFDTNNEIKKPLVDSTDSIALLTPFITEVDLWPSSLVKSCFLKEAKITLSLHCLENAVCDMSLMYVKEATLLKCYEETIDSQHLNSIPSSSSSMTLLSKLQSLKPTEEMIDEAAMNDVELL